MKVSQMRNRYSGFQMFFCLCICLCIFGSTKTQPALAAIATYVVSPVFDVANSTVIEAEDSSLEVSKNKISELVVPPQPRNKRGALVCTKDRYIPNERQVGEVSWYGSEFEGRRTASGELFNKNSDTIAHLTLPMGTYVRLENRDTGSSRVVRVNDCGPFVKGRIADLPYGLAKRLGLTNTGKAEVIITVL
jgi:rare lipoprotein A (peptidoglycan hydrolase)